jgi:HAD superfamily hydrolase (TIGR01490 family)
VTSQTGPVAAFFDIDKTVLEVNSGSKWTGHQWRSGKMSPWQVVRAVAWLTQYRFGLLDFESMARKVLANYRGQAVDPIYEEVEAWFAAEVEGTICAEARERIIWHRDEGHLVALLTSATRFLSMPLARVLGVEHVLCTELEVQEGILTGAYIEPCCYGEGKVHRAEAFAAEHDIDLQQSYFYSDSFSDLPMLERVGEPRVVNPDPRLRRKAVERDWEIHIWRAPAADPPIDASRHDHVGS